MSNSKFYSYWRYFFTIILFFLILSSAKITAQSNSNNDSDFTEVEKVYRKFESTVKNKDKKGHRTLYLANTLPVVVIPNTPNGPMDYYTSFVEGFINYFSQPDLNHELRISDIKYEKLNEGLILTEAKFEEFVDDELSSTGTDIFTYLKTDKGWKLLMLHNTVTLENDSTDYSTPVQFENSPEDLPAQVKTAIANKDKYGFIELFHSPLSPYMLVEPGFSEEFMYPVHTVGAAADRLPRRNFDIGVDYSNIESKIYDNYIAVLTLDFDLKVNGEVRRTGKQYWLLYATAATGWKISGVFQFFNNQN